MLAARANVVSSSSPLLHFKYSPKTPPTAVVKVTTTRRPMAASKFLSSPTRRALPESDHSSLTPEPVRKRKASPARDSSREAVTASDLKTTPSKAAANPKRPSSRAASVSSVTKRVKSVRASERHKSEELVDKYTPPPKRPRCERQFGSEESPLPRKCKSSLDGRVQQYSSRQVVESLLPTYISYFRDHSDPSSTKYQLKDGIYHWVNLEYPNTGASEQFPLLVPKDPQHYNPIMELMETLEVIVANYVPLDQRSQFGTFLTEGIARTVDDSASAKTSDLLRNLRKAEHQRDGPMFEMALADINKLLRCVKHPPEHYIETFLSLDTRNGSVSEADLIFKPANVTANEAAIDGSSNSHNQCMAMVGTWSGVPLNVWKAVLSETYQRCIGPSIAMLKEYTPHSSETYGELEAGFVSDIVYACDISSRTKFIDLGSGVGNVVLQLSLQVGCETYGIEIRERLHELARKQRAELEKRCRMWGLTANQVELEHGDFRESIRTRELLKEADVVLVNNFKFGPDLNASLANMFLDLKDGAKVVTLTPLLPENFRISIHTMSNPLAIFQQQEREYARGSVSWSMVGGKYFINRVDRQPLRDFAEANEGTIHSISRRSKYNPVPERRGSKRRD